MVMIKTSLTKKSRIFLIKDSGHFYETLLKMYYPYFPRNTKKTLDSRKLPAESFKVTPADRYDKNKFNK